MERPASVSYWSLLSCKYFSTTVSSIITETGHRLQSSVKRDLGKSYNSSLELVVFIDFVRWFPIVLFP